MRNIRAKPTDHLRMEEGGGLVRNQDVVRAYFGGLVETRERNCFERVAKMGC